MRILFLIFSLITLLFISSCQYDIASKSYLNYNIEDIKSNAVIKNQDEWAYLNCFQFIKNKDSFVLYNVNNDNELLKFDLLQDTLTKIKLPIPKSSESTTFKIINNKLICLYDKQFYSYDLQNFKLDTLNIKLDNDSYLINNHNFNCCNFINDSTFYLQLGKSSTYNYIDTSIFTFFTLRGNVYKLYKYSSDFNLRYIHYLNYLTANDKDTIYAINAMDNKALKYSPNGKIDSILIDGQNIPAFDTTAMTDLLYIKKYAENIFNARLFLFPKYFILIRQDFTPKKWKNYLYVFDRNLALLSKSKIKHSVNPRLILSEENHLIFINFDEKKMYRYDFN